MYGGGCREEHASGQSREAEQVVERERGGLVERVEDHAHGVDAACVLVVTWELAAPGGAGLVGAHAGGEEVALLLPFFVVVV